MAFFVGSGVALVVGGGVGSVALTVCSVALLLGGGVALFVGGSIALVVLRRRALAVAGVALRRAVGGVALVDGRVERVRGAGGPQPLRWCTGESGPPFTSTTAWA